MEPASGTLLIANPHLDDPNFLRTVVLLCDHNEEGSFGFVINRKLDFTVDELISELGDFKLPVFEGGPVELNTLHFIHQYPKEIPDGKEIVNGVYWGGDFEKLIEVINSRTVDVNKIRFFLGYSGWGAAQLATEMDEKTWIVSIAKAKFLFAENEKELWKAVLEEMGGEYKLILNAPLDPSLN
ncbi:MAG: YqgE/AlgH family protein [Niabella sp.]|nr:MAG: YqgE/AlgH family protein [Niabella sp.]